MNHVKQVDNTTHLWEDYGFYVITHYDFERLQITARSALYNGHCLYYIFERNLATNDFGLHQQLAERSFKNPSRIRRHMTQYWDMLQMTRDVK